MAATKKQTVKKKVAPNKKVAVKKKAVPRKKVPAKKVRGPSKKPNVYKNKNPSGKNATGQPVFRPTKQQRDMVSVLTGCGFTQEDIRLLIPS